MHIVNNLSFLGFICEMKLGDKNKVGREKCIPKECFNTLYDITIEDFKAFTTKNYLSTTKGWSTVW